MDIERCVAPCSGAGTKYAGLTSGRTCHCADALDAETRATSDLALCGAPCTGNTSQICGDETLLSIYGQIAEEVVPQPPPIEGKMEGASYAPTVTLYAESLAALATQETAASAAADELPPLSLSTSAVLPTGNGTVPITAGTVERNGPWNMFVYGVVAIGIIMVTRASWAMVKD